MTSKVTQDISRKTTMHISRLILALTLGTSAVAAQDKPKPSIKLNTTSDFIAVHAKGTAPQETTALEYRFAATGEIPMTAHAAGGVQARRRRHFCLRCEAGNRPLV